MSIKEESFILPLALAFLYTQPIVIDFIKKYPTKYIFQHFQSHGLNFITAFLFLSLNFILLNICFSKFWKNKYFIKSDYIAIIIVSLLFYLYHRFLSGDFTFYSLLDIKELEWIKILDIPILVVTILTATLSFHKIFKKKNKTDWQSIIKPDYPIQDIELDKYNRKHVYESLIKAIKNAEISRHKSITIGLINKWGEGKTSFIIFLEAELKKEHDTIIIKFNPWLSSNVDNLTFDFFQTLDYALSNYMYTGSLIRRYAKNLTNINNPLNPLKYLPDHLIGDRSNQKYFEKIKDIIVEFNKRIFVIIDDLDRLESKEIFNLFRVIRNSANFPQLIFIIPFDKEYVRHSLSEQKIYLPEDYLRKIFDAEISLPPIAKHNLQNMLFDSLKDVVYNRLSQITNENADKILDQIRSIIFDEGLAFFSTEKYTKIHSALFNFIKNGRDIIRFTNAIALSLKDNHSRVYIPDLFIIELLKANQLEVYRMLFENKNYLTEKSNGDDGAKFYELYEDEDQNSTRDSFDYINVKNEQYDILKRINFQIYKDLVTELFNRPKDQDFNEKFSIVYPFNFYNYVELKENGVSFDEIEELING